MATKVSARVNEFDFFIRKIKDAQDITQLKQALARAMETVQRMNRRQEKMISEMKMFKRKIAEGKD